MSGKLGDLVGIAAYAAALSADVRDEGILLGQLAVPRHAWRQEGKV